MAMTYPINKYRILRSTITEHETVDTYIAWLDMDLNETNIMVFDNCLI